MWRPAHLLFGLLLTSVASPRSWSADVPSRAELRGTLKQSWASLASFEFRSVECELDAQGRPDRSRPIRAHEFAYGAPGRYFFRATAPADPSKIVEWASADGRRHYRIQPFADDPRAIDSIAIRDQAEPGSYPFTMFQALWLVMPGGKPLFTFLDDPATRVEPADDPEGRPLVAIVAKHEGMPLRCELDPAHGWLPWRVTFEGTGTFEATDYARDNGRWFPSAGIHHGPGRSGVGQGFVAGSLAINRPIDAARFSPLPAPDGTRVDDLTRGTSTIQGGPEARERLLAAHPQSEPPADPPPDASASPRTFSWFRVLGAAFVLILAAAVILWVRHTRPEGRGKHGPA